MFRLASSLSVVTMVGVEMMLVVASARRALRIAAKLVPPSTMRPMPIETPSPIAPLGSTAPPLPAEARRLIRFVPDAGKFVMPTGVLLPLPSIAQVTPMSDTLSTRTSTIIASTNTCARRISSLSTMDIKERIILGGALTTIALVCGCAQTLT